MSATHCGEHDPNSNGGFSMTKSILAIATAAFAVLASASTTAAKMALKAPSRIYSLPMKGPCWWEPPVYYRNYAYYPNYPYNDVQLRPGCHNAYYAPRWSGYRWSIWTN
jgi:hypothetical protein